MGLPKVDTKIPSKVDKEIRGGGAKTLYALFFVVEKN